MTAGLDSIGEGTEGGGCCCCCCSCFICSCCRLKASRKLPSFLNLLSTLLLLLLLEDGAAGEGVVVAVAVDVVEGGFDGVDALPFNPLKEKKLLN